MPGLQDGSGRGFDRSYKRGAVMGLTVAEAFILLAFCLLLLFTWWQADTEQKSLIVADRIADLTPEQKAAILEGLSDGSFDLARELRAAGLDAADPQAQQRLSEFSRFMREEDLQRLMEAAVKLDPETRLSIAEAVEVTEEAALRASLTVLSQGDSTVDMIAERLQGAAADQGRLVALLNDRLGQTIRSRGGSIDGLGTISLPQSILFDIGQDKIRDPEFLVDLCSSWIDTLRQSGLDLSDLKIEGHASSEGAPGQTTEQAYLYNLDLSQKRAKNALAYCIEGLGKPDDQLWARQHLGAIGYSSARLIFNPDGTENREASRRVMFSVALNQDSLIEDIRRDVSAASDAMSATGTARIIDGDTVEIEGTTFRLSGIDAPELGQPCVNSEGVSFDCGEVARRGLEAAIGGRQVTCNAEARDFYQRPIALCVVDNTDLAMEMVTRGYAVPFTEYSQTYAAAGDAAQAAAAGLWNTQFEMPWDYRKDH